MKRPLLLLALLAAFPALSTDMYLGALPHLQRQWHRTSSEINLTLVPFFAAYCVFILFYGPLGDRFGRRPPLLAGISLYVLGSLILLLAPRQTPWGLALPMFIVSLSIGFGRPSGANLALEQIEKNAGMASSPLIFTFFVLGATAMGLIVWVPFNKNVFLAFLGLACGTLSMGIWLLVQRGLFPLRKPGPKLGEP
ncbi:MAG: MFS transporter [Deltaproteobacteria bacterium]|nr:MFS transporter [Deltaproteobacteria bacterium]